MSCKKTNVQQLGGDFPAYVQESNKKPLYTNLTNDTTVPDMLRWCTLTVMLFLEYNNLRDIWAYLKHIAAVCTININELVELLFLLIIYIVNV